MTQDLIAEHADGLVVLLGPASDVGQAVAARRPDRARKALGRWREQNDTAVEIVDHLDRKSTARAARMAELARKDQSASRADQRRQVPGPGRQPGRRGA